MYIPAGNRISELEDQRDGNHIHLDFRSRCRIDWKTAVCILSSIFEQENVVDVL
jgi:hypothetical protein